MTTDTPETVAAMHIWQVAAALGLVVLVATGSLALRLKTMARLPVQILPNTVVD